MLYTDRVTPAADSSLSSSSSLPEGIFRDENGAYHWIYRMHMLKNPTVLITLIKVWGGIFGALGLIMVLAQLFRGHAEYIPDTLLLILAICAGLIILSVIVWLIMAAARGGHYIVEHMMDENKVVYLSTPEEKKKVRNPAIASFLLSIAADDIGAAAAGAMLSASERFDSTYTDVKSIRTRRRRDLINVNNTLQKNTIYAAPHQYDFVLNYIVSHCPNAKIKGADAANNKS